MPLSSWIHFLTLSSVSASVISYTRRAASAFDNRSDQAREPLPVKIPDGQLHLLAIYRESDHGRSLKGRSCFSLNEFWTEMSTAKGIMDQRASRKHCTNQNKQTRRYNPSTGNKSNITIPANQNRRNIKERKERNECVEERTNERTERTTTITYRISRGTKFSQHAPPSSTICPLYFVLLAARCPPNLSQSQRVVFLFCV